MKWNKPGLTSRVELILIMRYENEAEDKILPIVHVFIYVIHSMLPYKRKWNIFR